MYSMFPRTYIVSCDSCCVTFVSFFINLCHPRDLTSNTCRRGIMCVNVWMANAASYLLAVLHAAVVCVVPGIWIPKCCALSEGKRNKDTVAVVTTSDSW